MKVIELCNIVFKTSFSLVVPKNKNLLEEFELLSNLIKEKDLVNITGTVYSVGVIQEENTIYDVFLEEENVYSLYEMINTDNIFIKDLHLDLFQRKTLLTKISQIMVKNPKELESKQENIELNNEDKKWKKLKDKIERPQFPVFKAKCSVSGDIVEGYYIPYHIKDDIKHRIITLNENNESRMYFVDEDSIEMSLEPDTHKWIKNWKMFETVIHYLTTVSHHEEYYTISQQSEGYFQQTGPYLNPKGVKNTCETLKKHGIKTKVFNNFQFKPISTEMKDYHEEFDDSKFEEFENRKLKTKDYIEKQKTYI